MEETHHGSIYYVIPAEVFEDKRLEATELKFYALISGLAYSAGYCFASNEYLATRMKVNERTIRKWLERMEEFGYIKREIKKIGMVSERKIWICHARISSNNSSYGLTGPDRAAPGPIEEASQGRIERAPRATIVSKEELVSEVEEIPPTPPKGEERASYGSYVKLKSKEYEKLCEKESKEAIDKAIEELNDYIAARGLEKKYKDYAAAIRNWLRSPYRKSEEQKKAKSREQKNPDGSPVENPFKGVW